MEYPITIQIEIKSEAEAQALYSILSNYPVAMAAIKAYNLKYITWPFEDIMSELVRHGIKYNNEYSDLFSRELKNKVNRNAI